jgi:hypothetical protein
VVRHRFAQKSLAHALIRSLGSRRRWLYAGLASLAVAASVTVPSLQAGADTGSIVVNSVSGDGTGDLAVSITSAIPLSAIKVHLISSSAIDVLDLSDFTAQGTFTASQPQTWTLNSPTTDLSGFAPGTYTATVDATDTDSDPTVMGLTPTTGTFNFLAQPVLTTASTFNTTKPNQQVNITGQLNGCKTLSCPAGGWPVGTTVTVTDTTATGQPSWTSNTTDSSGDFAVAGVVGIPGDSYSVAVAAVPSTSLAASATTTDVPQYATTTLTITPPASAPYGPEIVTGTLTYGPTSSPAPAPAGITITASAGALQAQTTTNANGTFSLTLPATTGSTTWTVSSQAQLTTTPFLFGATATVSATQTWPATISGFSVTLSRFYVVTVGGCLSSSISPPPPLDVNPPPIQIWYELTTAGPWKELGTVLMSPPMAGCAGPTFLASGSAPAAAAYYRAVFPGDNIYGSATGTSIRAAHTATRFSPFKASTSLLLLPNRKLTIHGTLQYQGPARWRAYASQRVLLIYCTGSAAHCNNNNNWFAYHWVRTNSLGNFSLTFFDTIGTAFWSANYNGNATHMAAGAPMIKVTVKRSGSRIVGSPLPRATPVQPLFTIMPTGQNWQQGGGMQFLIAADPLLILMGRQP